MSVNEPMPRCPACQAALELVSEEPSEMYLLGDPPMPLSGQSTIYRCAEHGLWRMYESGRMERLDESE